MYKGQSQISRMAWAGIRVRCNKLVELGKTPKEVIELLDKLLEIERVEKRRRGDDVPTE